MTLKSKAIKTACIDLLACENKEQANRCYLKWEFFKNEQDFKNCIIEIKAKLIN